MNVPDGVRPLVGYRSWAVDVGPVLRSVHRPFVWPRNGRAVAKCQPYTTPEYPWKAMPGYRSLRVGRFLWWNWSRGEAPHNEAPPPHVSPYKGCACGLHAGWTEKEAEQMGTTAGPGKVLIGPVAGWGHIVRGSLGFRAQYMKPLALFPGHEQADEVAELYGVPVIESEQFTELLHWESA